MRKINKPQDSVEEVFRTCIGNYQDLALKERLEAVVPVIIDASDKFEEKVQRTESHTIAPQEVVGSVVLAKEMVAVYDGKFAASKGPGRRYYDKYLAAPVNDRCPLCGIGFVSTLDHYLPKAQHPALAVTPANLVPACRDCNLGKKKSFIPQTAKEEPLHPYFDDVEKDVWLKVDLSLQSDHLVPTYSVIKPEEWDDVLFQRTKYHMELYDLYRLYAIHASEEIAARKMSWLIIYQKCGERILSEQLQDEANSREGTFLNSWQAALYRALVIYKDTVCQWLNIEDM